MKKTLTIIAVVLLAGVGSFYVGMKYQQSKSPASLVRGNFQDLRNLSDEERQQRLQQLGANIGGFRGGREGDGFANGEIIAKDDKSITVKLRDGGSKIIFYSGSAEISKFTGGTAADLEIGKSVSVSGKTNSDGSITAESIQLRPQLQTQPQE